MSQDSGLLARITARGSSRYVTVALAMAVFFALPHFFAPFQVFQLTQVLIYFLAVLAVSYLAGYSGQVSLGHSVFFAIGAYTVAITSDRMAMPVVVTAVLAFVIAAVIGAVTAVPALFMTGSYRVMVTLALAVVTPMILVRFADITGGSQGLPVPPQQAPSWTGLADDQYVYYLALAIVAVGLFLIRNLARGRMKRGQIAVKENEIVARSLGIDSARLKVVAFSASAAVASLAGVVYAYLVGYVTPSGVGLLLAVYLLVGACVAGLKAIHGALFGAAFLVYVPEYTSGLDPSLGAVFFGGTVIAVALLMPDGVTGWILSRLKAWSDPSSARAPDPHRPREQALTRVIDTTSASAEKSI